MPKGEKVACQSSLQPGADCDLGWEGAEERGSEPVHFAFCTDSAAQSRLAPGWIGKSPENAVLLNIQEEPKPSSSAPAPHIETECCREQAGHRMTTAVARAPSGVLGHSQERLELSQPTGHRDGLMGPTRALLSP